MFLGPAPAFWVSLSFIVGVFGGSFLSASFLSFFLLLIAMFIIGYGVFQKKQLVFCAIAVMVFVGGFWYVEAERTAVDTLPKTPKTVSGNAEIVSVPKRKELYQEVTLRFRSCENNVCPKTLVLARLPLSERYRFGDRMTLSCTLKRPENFTERFDYRMYLWKDGIGYLCAQPNIITREDSRFDWFFAIIERFEEGISSHIPEPESSLGIGLLIGGDERFSEEAKEWFRAAGLAHIVALSGFNISVISFYFLLFGILLFLPRKQAAVFAILASSLLVFAAGMPPSGIRALGMASTLLLALVFGRRYGSADAIVFAGVIMLLVNPLLLRYDVGFQLSLLATLGIVLFSPYFKFVLPRGKYLKPFVEAFFLTVAAEAFILPIIFVSFETFSLSAFLANTLLLPFIPVAMLFSFLAGIAGAILPEAGTIFSFPAYALLHLITEGARFFASIPYGKFSVASFGWIAIVFWYSVLWAVLFFLKRWKNSFFATIDEK